MAISPDRARVKRTDYRIVFNAYRQNDNALFTRADTRENDALYNVAYDYLAVYDGEAPFMLELQALVNNDGELSNRQAAKVLNNLIRTAEQQ